MIKNNQRETVFVTCPYLPPLEEYVSGLKDIWKNQWLTNDGPVLKKFTNKLISHFKSENLCLFTNGTLALQIGLQGMEISGEVITTPFTFVATTHALYWNKIRPVFVDIEPEHYTIDPDKIEKAITPWTSAILAVHVFGFPCHHEKLRNIANKHNLRLIYDAAHAFGVEVEGEPISNLGDLSLFSFHATKKFHSLEGGMLIFKEAGLKKTFNYLKNFGFKNEIEVVMPGTNAKMNEMQALMGLLVIKHIEEIIKKGRIVDEIYRDKLKDVPGIMFTPSLGKNVKYNYSYVPIEVDEKLYGMSRDGLYEILKKYNIFTRRYFYPLITDFSCYRHIQVNDRLSQARRIASRILCLPTYTNLTESQVIEICDIIKSIRN